MTSPLNHVGLESHPLCLTVHLCSCRGHVSNPWLSCWIHGSCYQLAPSTHDFPEPVITALMQESQNSSSYTGNIMDRCGSQRLSRGFLGVDEKNLVFKWNVLILYTEEA